MAQTVEGQNSNISPTDSGPVSGPAENGQDRAINLNQNLGVQNGQIGVSKKSYPFIKDVTKSGPEIVWERFMLFLMFLSNCILLPLDIFSDFYKGTRLLIKDQLSPVDTLNLTSWENSSFEGQNIEVEVKQLGGQDFENKIVGLFTLGIPLLAALITYIMYWKYFPLPRFSKAADYIQNCHKGNCVLIWKFCRRIPLIHSVYLCIFAGWHAGWRAVWRSWSTPQLDLWAWELTECAHQLRREEMYIEAAPQVLLQTVVLSKQLTMGSNQIEAYDWVQIISSLISCMKAVGPAWIRKLPFVFLGADFSWGITAKVIIVTEGATLFLLRTVVLNIFIHWVTWNILTEKLREIPLIEIPIVVLSLLALRLLFAFGNYRFRPPDKKFQGIHKRRYGWRLIKRWLLSMIMYPLMLEMEKKKGSQVSTSPNLFKIYIFILVQIENLLALYIFYNNPLNKQSQFVVLLYIVYPLYLTSMLARFLIVQFILKSDNKSFKTPNDIIKACKNVHCILDMKNVDFDQLMDIMSELKEELDKVDRIHGALSFSNSYKNVDNLSKISNYSIGYAMVHQKYYCHGLTQLIHFWDLHSPNPKERFMRDEEERLDFEETVHLKNDLDKIREICAYKHELNKITNEEETVDGMIDEKSRLKNEIFKRYNHFSGVLKESKKSQNVKAVRILKRKKVAKKVKEQKLGGYIFKNKTRLITILIDKCLEKPATLSDTQRTKLMDFCLSLNIKRNLTTALVEWCGKHLTAFASPEVVYDKKDWWILVTETFEAGQLAKEQKDHKRELREFLRFVYTTFLQFSELQLNRLVIFLDQPEYQIEITHSQIDQVLQYCRTILGCWSLSDINKLFVEVGRLEEFSHRPQMQALHARCTQLTNDPESVDLSKKLVQKIWDSYKRQMNEVLEDCHKEWPFLYSVLHTRSKVWWGSDEGASKMVKQCRKLMLTTPTQEQVDESEKILIVGGGIARLALLIRTTYIRVFNRIVAILMDPKNKEEDSDRKQILKSFWHELDGFLARDLSALPSLSLFQPLLAYRNFKFPIEYLDQSDTKRNYGSSDSLNADIYFNFFDPENVASNPFKQEHTSSNQNEQPEARNTTSQEQEVVGTSNFLNNSSNMARTMPRRNQSEPVLSSLLESQSIDTPYLTPSTSINNLRDDL